MSGSRIVVEWARGPKVGKYNTLLVKVLIFFFIYVCSMIIVGITVDTREIEVQ